MFFYIYNLSVFGFLNFTIASKLGDKLNSKLNMPNGDNLKFIADGIDNYNISQESNTSEENRNISLKKEEKIGG